LGLLHVKRDKNKQLGRIPDVNHTDHANLARLDSMDLHRIDPKHYRWYQEVVEGGSLLIHRPGASALHKGPDGLSRNVEGHDHLILAKSSEWTGFRERIRGICDAIEEGRADDDDAQALTVDQVEPWRLRPLPHAQGLAVSLNYERKSQEHKSGGAARGDKGKGKGKAQPMRQAAASSENLRRTETTNNEASARSKATARAQAFKESTAKANKALRERVSASKQESAERATLSKEEYIEEFTREETKAFNERNNHNGRNNHSNRRKEAALDKDHQTAEQAAARDKQEFFEKEIGKAHEKIARNEAAEQAADKAYKKIARVEQLAGVKESVGREDCCVAAVALLDATRVESICQLLESRKEATGADVDSLWNPALGSRPADRVSVEIKMPRTTVRALFVGPFAFETVVKQKAALWRERLESEYGVDIEMHIANPPFQTDDLEVKGFWLKPDARTLERV
jgi:hypothetical protein